MEGTGRSNYPPSLPGNPFEWVITPFCPFNFLLLKLLVKLRFREWKEAARHVPEANDSGTALAWGKLKEYRFRTACIKPPGL